MHLRAAIWAILLLPEVGYVGFGDHFLKIFGRFRRLQTLHALDIHLFFGALRVNPTWGVAHYAADRTYLSRLVLPREREGLFVIHCGRIRHEVRLEVIEVAMVRLVQRSLSSLAAMYASSL